MPNPVGPTSMLPFFSTEIYSFIHKRKSSQSSQMQISAFPFCFPACVIILHIIIYWYKYIYIPQIFWPNQLSDQTLWCMWTGKQQWTILLAPMGVLASGSSHAWPSNQPPIDTSRNLCHTCLQSRLQTSPTAPHKSYPKFGTLGQLLKIPPLSPQNLHSVGGRRGPRVFFVTLR